MRGRRSERFWTTCLRKRTVSATSTGAYVRPTLSCRLVRLLCTRTKMLSKTRHTSKTIYLHHSERGFEDHEYLVEPLSGWTRHSENKIFFVSRPQKYVMFTDPQVSNEDKFSSCQSLTEWYYSQQVQIMLYFF